MADDQEETSQTETSQGHESGPAGDGPSSSSQPTGNSTVTSGAGLRILEHLKSDKVKAVMWLSRIGTLFFSISYLLPFFGFNSYASGQRVLITAAITNALRLHQRVPRFGFNRQFLQSLIAEDSAHYLLYCTLMLLTTQTTYFILLPVFLYALLHVTSYTKELLNLAGPTTAGYVRRIITKIETKQREILLGVAGIEILLMPVSIFMLFTGQAALMLPFIYYRFLCLRYASVRNPYGREMFRQYRLKLEEFSNNPSCPGIISTGLRKIIQLTTRLSPVQQVPTNS